VAAPNPYRDLGAWLKSLQEKQDLLRAEYEEARQTEEDLKKRRIAKADELHLVQQKIAEAKKLREKAPNGNGADPFLEVSDHAALQYLALYKSLDVDSVREEVRHMLHGRIENILNLSTSTIRVGDKRFVVRDGKVISVLRD